MSRNGMLSSLPGDSMVDFMCGTYILALFIRALTTDLLADIGWLEFESKYWSVWVGFP